MVPPMATTPLVIQVGSQVQRGVFVDSGGDIQVSCSVLPDGDNPEILVSFRLGEALQNFTFANVKTCLHPTKPGTRILDEPISVKLGAVSIELNCDRDTD